MLSAQGFLYSTPTEKFVCLCRVIIEAKFENKLKRITGSQEKGTESSHVLSTEIFFREVFRRQKSVHILVYIMLLAEMSEALEVWYYNKNTSLCVCLPVCQFVRTVMVEELI